MSCRQRWGEKVWGSEGVTCLTVGGGRVDHLCDDRYVSRLNFKGLFQLIFIVLACFYPLAIYQHVVDIYPSCPSYLYILYNILYTFMSVCSDAWGIKGQCRSFNYIMDYRWWNSLIPCNYALKNVLKIPLQSHFKVRNNPLLWIICGLTWFSHIKSKKNKNCKGSGGVTELKMKFINAYFQLLCVNFYSHLVILFNVSFTLIFLM